jgi:hypothetical protein
MSGREEPEPMTSCRGHWVRGSPSPGSMATAGDGRSQARERRIRTEQGGWVDRKTLSGRRRERTLTEHINRRLVMRGEAGISSGDSGWYEILVVHRWPHVQVVSLHLHSLEWYFFKTQWLECYNRKYLGGGRAGLLVAARAEEEECGAFGIRVERMWDEVSSIEHKFRVRMMKLVCMI